MTDHLENLKAYDDYENLRTFTPESFESYCRVKLAGCQREVDRIREYCVGKGWTGKVVEIGSGNSKLLYALEKAGILQSGTGYDVSQSRHQFAEAFKSLVGSTKTKNVHGSIFDFEPEGDADLVCAMDIVIQMIAPIGPATEEALINWIQRSLKPNGYLVAELRDMSSYKEIIDLTDNQVYQFWEEFPPHDPWRYNLNRMSYANAKKDLRWDKCFLKRESLERSETTCVFCSYTLEQFVEVVGRFGLKVTAVLKDADAWFTVIAQKPA